MSDVTLLAEEQSFDEVLEIRDIAEFRVWSDGDLEIELVKRSLAASNWTGTFLTREEALRLREYLVRKYP